MGSNAADERMWSVRAFIYTHLVEHDRPPSSREAAAALSIEPEQAADAYQRLHERHAILLEPDSSAIRMANPFSGVPTGFHVEANGHTYWANCAWDALGIPAALRVDARIEAICADSQTPTLIVVAGDTVHGHREVVHFPLPLRQWYDDLIRT